MIDALLLKILLFLQNIWKLRLPVFVEVSVRDIERIPEASILTNRPYCYPSCLAVTDGACLNRLSACGLGSRFSEFGEVLEDLLLDHVS